MGNRNGTTPGHQQNTSGNSHDGLLNVSRHIIKGVDISKLNRAPECFKKNILPELKASADHQVFVEVPEGEWNGVQLKPLPGNDRDTWNDDHVCMPNDMKNNVNGINNARWGKIVLALTTHIPSTSELEKAITSYNPGYRRRWNFGALNKYFKENKYGTRIKDTFFTDILPNMQQLALKLPDLCPKPIPILKQRRDMKITLSQQQVACLLANAFFCTFPMRNINSDSLLLDINFSELYSLQQASCKFEKISCIINYFLRVTKNMPTGAVTYARQYLQLESDFWNYMDKKFTNLHVSTSGYIEDYGRGMLQADFSDKHVGNGVLGNGLEQEAVRFLICPEMILSLLFTEVLTDDEVVIMTGCERFNNYEGYSESFMFNGNHTDMTERDGWGRRWTEVVAMDALNFQCDNKSQFEEEKVLRELNKAYCSFKGRHSSVLPAVCTGNWGCGVFKGDKQLKALIQLMAASAAGRDVCFCTYEDAELNNHLGDFYNILKQKNLSISRALDLIQRYKNHLGSGTNVDTSLFKFIAKETSTNPP